MTLTLIAVLLMLAGACCAGDNAGMQTLQFDFCGSRHTLTIPDGEMCRVTAADIINNLSYPLPGSGSRLPVQCVVDAGAHVGEWTIMAAARWPNAIVHAFEPNPQVLPLLSQNCGPYRNVIIHQQGVDVAARRGPFYLNSISSAAAKSFVPEVSDAQWMPIEVDYVGADSVVALKPDILKLDIEGIEHRVIAAMGKAIADIPVIYVEFHEESIRIDLERLLLPTHSLCYARILHPRQGELTYARRA